MTQTTSAALRRGASPATHPRVLGSWGASALAMGGSNQSLFLLTALVASQGSAAIPLLVAGLLLAWAAAPGWTELSLMWPDRVGGIAASCAEAFRPYSPVLANLTGVCYWWGWVPTCGLTALLSASALHQFYFPGVPVGVMAAGIVLAFTALNLIGIGRVNWLIRLLAAGSATLAAASAVLPVLSGRVDWTEAFDWHLAVPFHGVFGQLTSAMAGLYLIGFAAPAYEAATCHVGEMRDPVRELPRAMRISAGMAGVYFLALPLVWLGVFGAPGLSDANGVELAKVLGPTFAPLFGGLAKGAAVWFMVLNMFHGTVQPLAGAARTLSQLAEDGLLPRLLERRNRFDVPWVATCLTAGAALAFQLAGDPIWMLAGANFTYLIGIGAPSVAVWLLRRNAPDMPRPWRAPRGTIVLGVAAAAVWFASTVLGFEQFGLPVVLFGLALAYSGSAFYAWRRRSDDRRAGAPRVRRSLHLKLTGAMLAVMVLDGTGYLMAVTSVRHGDGARVALLEDIFVGVAILTIGVGLVLPGTIAHSAGQVTEAAARLSTGTLAELTRAMLALGRGDLDGARAHPISARVSVTTQDEVGVMAEAFNRMQDEVARAATSLEGARRQLLRSHEELEYLATHDPLTHLPNRRQIEAHIEAIVASSVVDGRAGALVVVDLDGFKFVNDSRGHAVGDEVIRSVARFLQDSLRPHDLVGRLGGDEFAAVLPDVTEDEALAVLDRLVRGLRDREICVESGRPVQVTASVGIAFFNGTTRRSAHDLLIDADAAMYEAKDTGRDRIALASTGPVQADVRFRQTWVERIRDALEADMFVLHAQPILDLASGAVDRYELLLRMVEPDGSLVMPAEFLPAAERSGLICRIDRWVVREACRILGDSQRAGHHLHLEVNLSGPSLGDPDLLELVRDELAALPRPEGLVIEVTETAAITDVPRARAFADQLSALGCAFALDDFGAGYGSFYYLKHLPFDYLKIDGEFVRDLTRSHADQVVVRALVETARQLGKRTIAEFVEDAATSDLLRELGVDYAQGWHVGRPGPLPQLTAPGNGTSADRSGADSGVPSVRLTGITPAQ